MYFDNGLESEEEYEIDSALLAGSNIEIQFVLPEFPNSNFSIS